AGRQTIDDIIDHKAGIILKKKVGDRVEPGDALAILHTDREHVLETARKRTVQAFSIQPAKPKPIKLIHAMVTKDGVQKL
ncbi:MAG: pyrimidine-nucleoside phosphorylase, partial [Ignavibacteriae bacterium]|nr:pyrimidine-nucleoside phosphorylase [Ignavibacteriota bacterium]